MLLQPTQLKGLITSKPTLDNQPEGLYIENLTDKIADGVNSSTSCRINKMKLTDTKLGIDSYKILRYLYLVKNEKNKHSLLLYILYIFLRKHKPLVNLDGVLLIQE